MIRRWWRRRRCPHQSLATRESWIKSALIDTGMRKMFWCDRCERTWFT